MLTIVRFENLVLLQYNKSADAYEITEDDLMGFPYEAYEPVTLKEMKIYELYLDEQGDYPIVRQDRWIEAENILEFISSYSSGTDKGQEMMKKLYALFLEYLSLREA